MNVTPVQNNNSQSFGMAFKLKGDGAKKLATALEEVSSEHAPRFEKNVLDKIHASKTDVIYDGKDVIIKANSEDVFDNSWNPEELIDLVVCEQIPVAMPDTCNKVFQYAAKVGNDPLVFKVAYHKSQTFLDIAENSPLTQKLFNAKEILRVLDVKATDRAYKAELAATKMDRIDATVKRLEELYG